MNKVILMGRLTRDPEIRYTNGTNGQMAVARFNLAVDRRVARNANGNQQTADFISCIAFQKRAEFLEKYCSKGTKLVVEGRIQTGSYTHQRTGEKVYTTDVCVENLEFAESKNSSSHGNANSYSEDVDPGRGPEGFDGFMSIPDNVEDEGLPFN